MLTLPEEVEERREEFGGLELFVEVVDTLVVAGITAGASLSRAAPLQIIILLLDTHSPRKNLNGK